MNSSVKWNCAQTLSYVCIVIKGTKKSEMLSNYGTSPFSLYSWGSCIKWIYYKDEKPWGNLNFTSSLSISHYITKH